MMLFDTALAAMEGDLRAGMEAAITELLATARTQLEGLLEAAAQQKDEGLAVWLRCSRSARSWSGNSPPCRHTRSDGRAAWSWMWAAVAS